MTSDEQPAKRRQPSVSEDSIVHKEIGKNPKTTPEPPESSQPESSQDGQDDAWQGAMIEMVCYAFRSVSPETRRSIRAILREIDDEAP